MRLIECLSSHYAALVLSALRHGKFGHQIVRPASRWGYMHALTCDAENLYIVEARCVFWRRSTVFALRMIARPALAELYTARTLQSKIRTARLEEPALEEHLSIQPTCRVVMHPRIRPFFESGHMMILADFLEEEMNLSLLATAIRTCGGDPIKAFILLQQDVKVGDAWRAGDAEPNDVTDPAT